MLASSLSISSKQNGVLPREPMSNWLLGGNYKSFAFSSYTLTLYNYSAHPASAFALKKQRIFHKMTLKKPFLRDEVKKNRL